MLVLQCNEDGSVTRNECPTEPPIIIKGGSLGSRVFFMILEAIGLHGFVGFFGGLLLILGLVKLLFGGVVVCRKSKAQLHYEELIAKGTNPKSKQTILYHLMNI